MQKQEELKLAQWIYTTGDNSEFLYIIGGPNPLTLFVAKVDAISLQGKFIHTFKYLVYQIISSIKFCRKFPFPRACTLEDFLCIGMVTFIAFIRTAYLCFGVAIC